MLVGFCWNNKKAIDKVNMHNQVKIFPKKLITVLKIFKQSCPSSPGKLSQTNIQVETLPQRQVVYFYKYYSLISPLASK